MLPKWSRKSVPHPKLPNVLSRQIWPDWRWSCYLHKEWLNSYSWTPTRSGIRWCGSTVAVCYSKATWLYLTEVTTLLTLSSPKLRTCPIHQELFTFTFKSQALRVDENYSCRRFQCALLSVVPRRLYGFSWRSLASALFCIQPLPNCVYPHQHLWWEHEVLYWLSYNKYWRNSRDSNLKNDPFTTDSSQHLFLQRSFPLSQVSWNGTFCRLSRYQCVGRVGVMARTYYPQQPIIHARISIPVL